MTDASFRDKPFHVCNGAGDDCQMASLAGTHPREHGESSQHNAEQGDSIPQEEIKERGLEEKPHARRSEPSTFLLCTPQMGMFATITNLPRHARLPSVRSRERVGMELPMEEVRLDPVVDHSGSRGAFPVMTGEGGKWWLITPRGRLATSIYLQFAAGSARRQQENRAWTSTPGVKARWTKASIRLLAACASRK